MARTTEVRGKIYAPDGSPSAYAEVTFELSGAGFDRGVVLRRRVQAKADDAGELTANLWPNEKLGSGTVYEVTVRHKEARPERFKIIVPDSDDPVYLHNILEADPTEPLSDIEKTLLQAQKAASDAEKAASEVEATLARADSKVEEVTQKVDDAEEHADKAREHAHEASRHVDSTRIRAREADGAAERAEERRDEAADYRDQAEEQATRAEHQAGQASHHKQLAETYREEARQYRDAAGDYADEAKDQANRSEHYAEQAAEKSRLEAGSVERLCWDRDPWLQITGEPGEQKLDMGIPRGRPGPVGPPGPPGTRATLAVRGVLESVDHLPEDDVEEGDAYIIDGRVYIRSDGEWHDALEFSGELVDRPYLRQIYVSAEAGDDNEHDGMSPSKPFRTIGRALAEARRIHAELDTEELVHANTPIVAVAVYPGTYEEDHQPMYDSGELDTEHGRAVARYGILEVPESTGVYGIAGQYMTDVMPKPDGANFNNEDGESGKPLRNLNLFLCQQSTFIQGFTIRGQEIDDMEDPNGGFAVALSPGKSINRSPYVRDIAQVSNYEALRNPAPPQPHVRDPYPNPAVGKGGGTLLVDRAVTPPDTMFPYMLGFAATTRSPNGMAYVAKNGGGLNTITTVTLFAQTHFYSIRGGHITMNTTGTQFGDITLRASDSMAVVYPYRFGATVPEIALASKKREQDEVPEVIQTIRNAALAEGATFLDVQKASIEDIGQYTGPLVHDYIEWLKDHPKYSQLPWSDPYIEYICHRDGMIFLQTLENVLLTGMDFSARTFVLFLFSYRPEDKWRDNIRYSEGDVVNDRGSWYRALKDVRGGERPSQSDDWERADDVPEPMLPETEGQVQYVFEGGEYDPQLMIDAFIGTYEFMLERLRGKREPHNSENSFPGIVLSDENLREMGLIGVAQILEAAVYDVIIQTLRRPQTVEFGSLIESLGHQFNNVGSGVNHHALPVNMRRTGWHMSVNQTIVQDRGGRVRFNGSDELNNQYLARDVRIDGRTGRFEGRAFQATVRQIARRIANSRGSF